MSDEHVILVDHTDNPIGAMEKLEAHKTGVLHRAFSVFVFNKEGELMLQQRALHKYHSPGLWTNTCCSHPRPKEKTLDAAKRRLQEEMGFTCELSPAFSFIYKATFDNGLTEHELDHVFIGYADTTPDINPDEVADWSYQSLDNIKKNIALHPENYTFWFKHCFEKLCAHIEINN